ncbi:VCBS repeat-containing protein [Spirosoma taeanense]|uniref:VCBS repeat-containing protein n=1 Tax=Spirosoma taeanense TaxID=2735870 RepID=A0A6M5Y604_9BACT|nr:VCBS repeat-containing protein [Spirosoma taeanense]QJW88846.1 VCBS repeat-containing protein [Spirosoma taeanense]
MFFLRLTALLVSLSCFVACQSSSSTETSATSAPPAPTQLTGQQLSQTYCGSCHLAPDPAMLDKATWQKGVLPQMALRMGQSNNQMSALAGISNTDELTRIIAANIFPEKPTLHADDWQKIVSYYVTNAPDEPKPQAAHAPIQLGLPLFRVQPSTGQGVDGLVTLLQYDSVAHKIWAGDRRGYLYSLDQNLRRTDSLRLSSPPTAIQPNRDGSFNLLTAGVLNPNDQLAGAWSHIARPGQAPTVQLQNLLRPVQATPADLNRDGREDVVVCQFGHYLGKLTWHERLGTGYREHVLDAVPGARLVIVRDANNDQWPDVVALLTQGDEQVAIYLNQRNGQFQKQTVLRFPSVYGSSYLELTDIDRDGDSDLVYTNGDNADYSPVLKAYHGVRIYLNDGQFRFRQAWFYPMHGATQTVIRDFDQDGDLDMAAIAHFPDFSHRPNESFIYFENQGNLRFVPRTFPKADQGRWLTMDAGDIDQDGDDDILLGSFFRPTSPQYADLMNQWRKPGAGILVLKNTLH